MCVSAKLQNREKFQTAMWHIPFLQQHYLLKKCMEWFNNFKQLQTVQNRIKQSGIKESSILSQKVRRIGRKSHLNRISDDKSLEQRLTEIGQEIESNLQSFKTYEGFCEAAPQFVLQGSLWLIIPAGSGLSKAIKIVSLCFSFGSLVLAASGVCIKNPFIYRYTPAGEKEEKEERKVPNQSSTLRCVIAMPLLTAVVTPRLLSLCMIASKAKGWPHGVMLALTLICHAICFTLLIKRQKKVSWQNLLNKVLFGKCKLSENIWMSFITSLIVPCVVIDSEEPYLMLSSISSTMAHVLYLILFLVTVNFFPETLRNWETCEVPHLELCLFSIIMIVLSLMSVGMTYQLQMHVRQYNEEKQIEWALESEDPKKMNELLKMEAPKWYQKCWIGWQPSYITIDWNRIWAEELNKNEKNRFALFRLLHHYVSDDKGIVGNVQLKTM